ncbi:hypothetical protein Btru_063299 [Bulinus truncatus]|nr:hypothetical protein Btru_063299 [Bulinus truncatus]
MSLVFTTAEKDAENSPKKAKSRENLKLEKNIEQADHLSSFNETPGSCSVVSEDNGHLSSFLTNYNPYVEIDLLKLPTENDEEADFQNETKEESNKLGEYVISTTVNSSIAKYSNYYQRSKDINKSNESKDWSASVRIKNKNYLKIFRKVVNKVIYEKRRSKFFLRQEPNEYDESRNLVSIVKYLLSELSDQQGSCDNNFYGLDNIASTSHSCRSADSSSEKINPAVADTFNSLIDFLLLNPEEIENLEIDSENLQLLIDFLHARIQDRCFENLPRDQNTSEKLLQSTSQSRNEARNIYFDSPLSSSLSVSEYTSHRSHPSSPSSGNISNSIHSTNESSVDPDSDASTIIREPNRHPGTSQANSVQSTWSQGISDTRAHILSNAPTNLASLASTAVSAVTGFLDPLPQVDNSQAYYTGLASILSRRGPPLQELQPPPGAPVPNRRRRLRPTHLQNVAPSLQAQPRPQPLTPPPDTLPHGVNAQNRIVPQPRLPGPILAQIRGYGRFPPNLAPILVPPPPPPPPPPLPGQHIRPPQAHEAGQLIIHNQHLHHPPATSPLTHRRVSNVMRRHSSNSR